MSLNILAISLYQSMINLFIYSVHSLIYSLHVLHLYHVPRTMQNIKTPELSVVNSYRNQKGKKGKILWLIWFQVALSILFLFKFYPMSSFYSTFILLQYLKYSKCSIILMMCNFQLVTFSFISHFIFLSFCISSVCFSRVSVFSLLLPFTATLFPSYHNYLPVLATAVFSLPLLWN